MVSWQEWVSTSVQWMSLPRVLSRARKVAGQVMAVRQEGHPPSGTTAPLQSSGKALRQWCCSSDPGTRNTRQRRVRPVRAATPGQESAGDRGAAVPIWRTRGNIE